MAVAAREDLEKLAGIGFGAPAFFGVAILRGSGFLL
jgi:hypothetical protein